ncbi:MAG: hypothetical protein ACK4YO_01870 [Candidatus Altarchaeaceae archaeon]
MDYFDLTENQLRNLLIEKHKKFLKIYKEELEAIRTKRKREINIRKKVEILPFKKDLFEYWEKTLEEELEKENDENLKNEVSQKISALKEEIRQSELELSAYLQELQKIENESEENEENREKWLIKRIESHEKLLNFWENYKK